MIIYIYIYIYISRPVTPKKDSCLSYNLRSRSCEKNLPQISTLHISSERCQGFHLLPRHGRTAALAHPQCRDQMGGVVPCRWSKTHKAVGMSSCFFLNGIQ